MITFDDFRHEWETHRVGDDSLVIHHEETNDTKYQCVSLIKQYIRECFGIEPGAWGNAIDYWSRTNPTLLTKFSKDSSGNVQKGDIAVLRTLGHADYTEPGHIGIATGNGDPNSIEILEQNGLGSGTGLGQDAIRTRFIPRNRIAGVLRPIQVTDTPIPVIIPSQKFVYLPPSVASWTAYRVGSGLRKGTSDVIGTLSPSRFGGLYYAIQGWVSNNAVIINTETYGQVAIWVKDTDAQFMDSLPQPALAPVAPKPPAPPEKYVPAETYDVITKLMVFPSAVDAKSLSNYTGTDLEPGKYFVFAKIDNAYNLSTNNVQNQNKWVRITDNVITAAAVLQPTLPVDAPATDITLPVDPPPPPVIADVLPTAPHEKPQYGWIRDDREPVRLTSTNSTTVKIADLEGQWPTQDFPAHHTEDYSMFTVVRDIEYWLPDKTRKKGYMYGLNVAFLPEEQPIKPTLMDRNANNRNDIIDLFDNGLQGFIETSSKYLDGIKRAVTVVAPKVQPMTKRIGKTIDGFSSRRKDK